MKKVVFILVLTFSAFIVSAQDSKEIKDAFLDGEYFLAYEEYIDALPYYLEVYRQNPDNANVNYKIGLCYLNIIGQKQESIPYFHKAILNTASDYKEGNFKEERAPNDAFFFLGNAYQLQYKLDEAEEYYNEYLKLLDPVDTVNINFVNQGISSCKNARKLMNDPVYFDAQNLGNNINSDSNEYAAVVSGDGTTIVYVSSLKFYNAIFYAKKVGGEWGLPVNITPDLESDGDYSPTGLSYNGETMLLARNDNFNSDIYISKIVDGSWSPARKLGKNINTKFWESHAALSKDENTLYFTSNKTDGYGGLDIYKSEKDGNGEWGPAVNMGTVVNSQFNEETPFVCSDNDIMYFSSQGHKTMGGFDIFKTNLSDEGNWSEPENIGYPLNTADDDLFFLPRNEGINGYLSSIGFDPNRGSKDIYYLNIFSDKNPRPVEIKGSAHLAGQVPGDNDQVQVSITGGNSNSPVTMSTSTTDGNYSFTTIVPGSYKMSIQKEGYITQTKNFTVPDDYSMGEVLLDANLAKIPEPEKIILNNIYFEFASAKLTNEQLTKIDAVISVLKSMPDLKIEVAGFADSKGSDSYNKTLSLKRAKSVVKYMVKQGIDKDRVTAKEYGETNFIAINENSDGSDSPEGREFNRRVEFQGISGGDKIVVKEKVIIPASLKAKE
ncbi:MAG: OmpA family protein [Bacteroidales bacterium]|nr:OmpA family protein [Bacteroidales bacterium]